MERFAQIEHFMTLDLRKTILKIKDYQKQKCDEKETKLKVRNFDLCTQQKIVSGVLYSLYP